MKSAFDLEYTILVGTHFDFCMVTLVISQTKSCHDHIDD